MKDRNPIKLYQIEDITIDKIVNMPTVNVGDGLIGGGPLTGDITISLDPDFLSGITNIEKGNIIRGTGISTEGSLIERIFGTENLTIGFDIPWGDNRYHNRLNIITNQAVYNFLGNVEGIQVTANTSGSNGFPGSLGSTVMFYTGSNSQASAMGRTFGMHRLYNTERYFLGSSTTGGATNPWREIYHFGNLDISQYVTVNQLNQAIANIDLGDGPDLSSYATIQFVNDAIDTIAFDRGNLANGTGIAMSGTLSNRLVNAGDVTVGVDGTVLRESNDNSVVGLKTFRRAGSNQGGTNTVVKFDIEAASTDLYNFSIMNSQNILNTDAEVLWHFRSTFNRNAGVAKTLDIISFFKGVFITGGLTPSSSFNAEQSTWYANTANDFPVKGYHIGINQFVNGVTIGSSNGEIYNEVLTGQDVRLYVNGAIKAASNITINPANVNDNGPAWRFGTVTTDASITPTHKARISIAGVQYEVLLRQI